MAETVALVGEFGLGQDGDGASILALLPYPAASHPSGAIRFKGENLLALPPDALRHVRGNKISMIFQEPMTSLNPLHTIEQQVGEVLKIHRGLSAQRRRARACSICSTRSASTIRRAGSTPIRISSPAASGSG